MVTGGAGFIHTSSVKRKKGMGRVKERSFNLPPNKKERLLAPTLLRTVRESFPSYGSSIL